MFLSIGILFQISRAWLFSATTVLVQINYNTGTSEDKHVWDQNEFNHVNVIAYI